MKCELNICGLDLNKVAIIIVYLNDKVTSVFQTAFSLGSVRQGRDCNKCIVCGETDTPGDQSQ